MAGGVEGCLLLDDRRVGLAARTPFTSSYAARPLTWSAQRLLYLYSYGLYSYGPYTSRHGLYIYGLYSYGLSARSAQDFSTGFNTGDGTEGFKGMEGVPPGGWMDVIDYSYGLTVMAYTVVAYRWLDGHHRL